MPAQPLVWEEAIDLMNHGGLTVQPIICDWQKRLSVYRYVETNALCRSAVWYGCVHTKRREMGEAFKAVCVRNTYRYSLPNVGAALASGGDRLNESCRFDWSDSQRRRLRAGRFRLVRLLLLRIDSRTSANPIVPCARAPPCR